MGDTRSHRDGMPMPVLNVLECSVLAFASHVFPTNLIVEFHNTKLTGAHLIFRLLPAGLPIWRSKCKNTRCPAARKAADKSKIRNISPLRRNKTKPFHSKRCLRLVCCNDMNHGCHLFTNALWSKPAPSPGVKNPSLSLQESKQGFSHSLCSR